MPVLDSDSELPRPADSDYAEHTPCLWSSLVVCVTQSKRAIVTAQSAAYSELRRSLFIHISFTVVNHVCLFIILWAAFTNCTNCTFPPPVLRCATLSSFRDLNPVINNRDSNRKRTSGTKFQGRPNESKPKFKMKGTIRTISQTKKSNNDSVEPLLS